MPCSPGNCAPSDNPRFQNGTQVCRTCCVEKPFVEFSRHSSTASGYRHICKECTKITNRAWRDANREKIAEQTRAWVQANPKRVSKMRAEWRQANVEKARRLGRTSESRRRDRQGDGFAGILKYDPCAYCGGLGGTVDHIVPQKDGGPTEWENMAGACHSCNTGKGTSSLVGYLLIRRLRVEREAVKEEIRLLARRAA